MLSMCAQANNLLIESDTSVLVLVLILISLLLSSIGISENDGHFGVLLTNWKRYTNFTVYGTVLGSATTYFKHWDVLYLLR